MDINKISKRESEVLDVILKTVIENGHADSGNLPALGNNYLSDLDHSIKSDYKYFVNLLKKFDILEVVDTIGGGFVIYPIPLTSKDFYDEGGFVGIYEKNQNKIKYDSDLETIRMNKLKWDSKLSKWQSKTFWYVFVLGIIGGICGIVSLGLQLFK